jgi:hypothetical protein
MSSPVDRIVAALGLPEYPLLFSWTDDLPDGAVLPAGGSRACLFALLSGTRRDGTPVALSRSRYGCGGAGYYLGFLKAPRDGIEHFLSGGIPGRMDGERYKKSAELARAYVAKNPPPRAAGRYGLFTRADRPRHGGDPQAVIFFASGDALAGLHFLANFDREDEAVAAPFSSGCGGIVTLPLLEAARPSPRAVIGLFDPSARPYVDEGLLTFAVPYRMFLQMAANAPESFLATKTWRAVKRRAPTERPRR